jgi:UDP-N-acetyl-D-glucosamine dehydrogenase
MSYIEAAAKTVAKHARPGQLIVLESTTYPGTTEEYLLPALQDAGLRIDSDVFVAFSPERVDPGNVLHTGDIPKVVGGVSQRSGEIASAAYSRLVRSVHVVSSARAAELTKLLENTYRAVNIALVNEMAVFCHELGIDLWDAIRAAATKPFGFQPFFPGPGVGGHCIPIDPNYLSHNVRAKLGYPFRFVELAQEINATMPGYITQRIQNLLNQERKALNGATVLLLGVTYKQDIADQRESPAVPVGRRLMSLGANVVFHDPHVPVWNLAGQQLDRVPDLDSALVTADIVVILQGHNDYDGQMIAKKAAQVFDTRGITPPSPNVQHL